MMNKIQCTLLICISVLLTIFCSSSAYSAQIIIGGTGNAIGTMRLLAQAYQRSHPQIEIIVLPSIGSSGGIKAVPNGHIDIGLSARVLKKSESETGIIAIEYARSPTVIVVSNNTNVKAITVPQLVGIYNGTIKKWPDGSVIRPVIRQSGDDNTKQIKALSADLKSAVEIAEKRQGMLFAATDQETVEKIEKTPGSFGVTSLALLLSEKRNLRPLTLNGINPSIESSIEGDYPMIKRFFFVLPVQPSAKVNAFLHFISSAEATTILKQNGNYPVR